MILDFLLLAHFHLHFIYLFIVLRYGVDELVSRVNIFHGGDVSLKHHHFFYRYGFPLNLTCLRVNTSCLVLLEQAGHFFCQTVLAL